MARGIGAVEAGAKVLSTRQLIYANAYARKHYNRSLDGRFVASRVDPGGMHLLGQYMAHGADALRCHLFVKVAGRDEPVQAEIDVPMDFYASLPDAKLVIRARRSPRKWRGAEAGLQRTHGTHRCGVCGEDGHTRRSPRHRADADEGVAE